MYKGLQRYQETKYRRSEMECIKWSHGSLARTDSDKADTFAEYFVTVSTDDDKKLKLSDFDFQNDNHYR